jgi:hypothetical protein
MPRLRKTPAAAHHGTNAETNTGNALWSLRLRSEGQPDAEFPRPRAHRKRQHARDAHHCNRQRDRREYAKHQRV